MVGLAQPGGSAYPGAYVLDGTTDRSLEGLYLRKKDDAGGFFYERDRVSQLRACDAGRDCGLCLMALPPPQGVFKGLHPSAG